MCGWECPGRFTRPTQISRIPSDGLRRRAWSTDIRASRRRSVLWLVKNHGWDGPFPVAASRLPALPAVVSVGREGVGGALGIGRLLGVVLRLALAVSFALGGDNYDVQYMNPTVESVSRIKRRGVVLENAKGKAAETEGCCSTLEFLGRSAWVACWHNAPALWYGSLNIDHFFV